jgi:hypothetical protein
MNDDQIVEDIRHNAARITRKAGGTLHGLIRMLMREQAKNTSRLVRLQPKVRFAATGTNGH